MTDMPSLTELMLAEEAPLHGEFLPVARARRAPPAHKTLAHLVLQIVASFVVRIRKGEVCFAVKRSATRVCLGTLESTHFARSISRRRRSKRRRFHRDIAHISSKRP
jgi:hypothetical protein